MERKVTPEARIPDIEELKEDFDLEAKLCRGRDGQGALSKDFWPTYSAMANTEGGIVFLGVEEKPVGVFSVKGIPNVEKVRKALWDGLNNRQVVSINLLANHAIQLCIHDTGVQYLRVEVPQAARRQKPVYVGGNPETGTYRRNYEGDYQCDIETVRRMFAEQVEDNRDGRLLEHFSFDDLDMESFATYRTHLKNRTPDHPFNDLDNREFLRSLGGWTCDRPTGKEGLTIAGVLMFGKLRSILDVVPNYVVDYQERPHAKTEKRWIDRVTTDGTWSGNLYDFYRMVIKRLFSDLKVPFQLKGDQREDETPVHEALREALVNTLIHADYTARVSVLAVKRPDLFGFRNPGLPRLPMPQIFAGGNSDCRNRNLQKMFQLIGLGEQAGSGFPKILRGWDSQSWRRPEMAEQMEPEQTILTLHMSSLQPEAAIQELEERLGADFRKMPELQRIALVALEVEGSLTHRRLMEITNAHPRDLTAALHELVRQGYIESDGQGRGTFYFFPGHHPIPGGDVFEVVASRTPSISSEHKAESSEHKAGNSEHIEAMRGRFETFRASKRAKPEVVQEAVLTICAGHWVSTAQLANILGRSELTIRTHYVNRLLDKEDGLEMQFANLRNHPRQKYRTKRK